MKKKLLSLIVFVLSGTGLTFSSPPHIAAQTCMPQRIINQYRCVSDTGQCATYVSTRVGYACSRTGSSALTAKANCDSGCGGGEGSCNDAYCSVYQPNTYACAVEAFTASCSGPPACDVRGTIRNCTSALDSCTEGNQPLNQQCYYNPATSPPPATGGCSSGDCFTGIANCGAVGRDNGSGSCSGGLCCVPKSGYTPGCPYNGGQTGYPSCRHSEGNGCNGQCCSDWNSVTNSCNVPLTCNGCADGLVGGGCSCPYCGITITPDTVTVAPGGSVDLSLVTDTNFGIGFIYQYSTPGIASVQQIGNVMRVTGIAQGTTTVTVLGNWSGYSPRTICSKVISIAVATPATPTPVNCAAMGAVTGTQLACANSLTGNGVIRWTWPNIAGVTSYAISLSNTLGNIITPVQNIDATSLNCASGTCRYDSSGLNPDGYILRVRPVTGSCVPTTVSTVSNTIVVSICPVDRISIVGKRISTADTSCVNVDASTTYVNPLTFSFSPALSPASQTQTGSSPVVWNNVAPNTYTVTATSPADYYLKFACWDKTGGAPFSSGLSARADSGETLRWQLGYTVGKAWSRVIGGDATICQNVTSPIPASLGANRRFMTSAAVGSPGVVYYGTDYDFDGDVVGKGENYVSSTNWLAQESGTSSCTDNWYQFLLNKYGLATAPADMGAGTYSSNTFPSRVRPYKVSGNMTTQGTWNYNTDGENVVIFVEGDLRINGEIRVGSRSFVSFVVQGNIIVDPSVGGNVGSTTPNIEGVYVTSGGFNTGVTNNNGSAKLIVNGIVIANSFALQRDLDGQNANTTTPSEEFRYNPMYLLTLPNEFMDMQIKWEEVAP